MITKLLVNNLTTTLEAFATGVVDLNLAVEQMIDIIEKNERGEFKDAQDGEKTFPSILNIQTLVADKFEVNIKDMIDRSRKRDLVQPRQIAMSLCRKYCNPLTTSLKKVGAAFGNRDHSTVIYAADTVEDLIETDRVYKKVYQELEQKIKLLF